MDKATETELNGFKVRLKFEVLSYGEIKNQYNQQDDMHLKLQALTKLKQQSKVIKTAFDSLDWIPNNRKSIYIFDIPIR